MKKFGNLAMIDQMTRNIGERVIITEVVEENKYREKEGYTDTNVQEINSFKKYIDNIKEVIIETEDAELMSLFKKLLRFLKERKERYVEKITIFKRVQFHGYSENTWEGYPVDQVYAESINLDQLNAEIDEFTAQFK